MGSQMRRCALPGVDFRDGAFKRKAEGIYGTFKALEEVDLHHGDEDALAALLGEPAENLVFIGGADCSGQIVAQEAGWVVEGELAER